MLINEPSDMDIGSLIRCCFGSSKRYRLANGKRETMWYRNWHHKKCVLARISMWIALATCLFTCPSKQPFKMPLQASLKILRDMIEIWNEMNEPMKCDWIMFECNECYLIENKFLNYCCCCYWVIKPYICYFFFVLFLLEFLIYASFNCTLKSNCI